MEPGPQGCAGCITVITSLGPQNSFSKGSRQVKQLAPGPQGAGPGPLWTVPPTLSHTPPQLQGGLTESQVLSVLLPGTARPRPAVCPTAPGSSAPHTPAQPGSPGLWPSALCHLCSHRSKRSCRPRRWPGWPWGTSTTTRWDRHSPELPGLGGLLGWQGLLSDPVPFPHRASWAPWRPSGGSRAWRGCGGAWAGLCPESWLARLPSWLPSPLPRPGCMSGR